MIISIFPCFQTQHFAKFLSLVRWFIRNCRISYSGLFWHIPNFWHPYVNWFVIRMLGVSTYASCQPLWYNLTSQNSKLSSILLFYWLILNIAKLFLFFNISFLFFTSFSFQIQFSIELPLIIRKHSILFRSILPCYLIANFCCNCSHPLLHVSINNFPCLSANVFPF